MFDRSTVYGMMFEAFLPLTIGVIACLIIIIICLVAVINKQNKLLNFFYLHQSNNIK